MNGYQMTNGRWADTIALDLSPAAPIAVDGYSAAVEVGDYAVARLALTATSVSPSDVLDVTLQTSHDGTTWYTAGTFTQVTANGTERKCFAVDRFVRAHYNVTGSESSAGVVGTVNLVDGTPTMPTTQTLILSVDGAANVTVTFSNPANLAAIATAINTAVGKSVAAAGGTGNKFLALTSTTTGSDSSIAISASSTALTVLGLTAGTVTGTDIALAVTLTGEAA